MATDVDQTTETTRVAREYFAALARGEADAPRRYYAADGLGAYPRRDRAGAARGERRLLQRGVHAFPDWRFEVLELVVEGDGAAVRWRARGTFAGPGSFMGFEPNGARVDVQGMDICGSATGGSRATTPT